MQILAPLDLRNGRVPPLVGDDAAAGERDEDDPLHVAAVWRARGIDELVAVDVDAALGRPNQWHAIPALVKSGSRVDFGGGIRSMTQIQQLLDMGIRRVIVGTQALENPLWGRELGIIFPGRIVLALESRQGNVQTRGRTDHVVGAAVAWAAEMDDAKLAGFLYHDLDAGAGADEVAAVCAAAKRTPVMVRGGVETGKRVEAMRRDGAASVVVEPSFVDASVLMPGRGR